VTPYCPPRASPWGSGRLASLRCAAHHAGVYGKLVGLVAGLQAAALVAEADAWTHLLT
jgi:hypothetical protein